MVGYVMNIYFSIYIYKYKYLYIYTCHGGDHSKKSNSMFLSELCPLLGRSPDPKPSWHRRRAQHAALWCREWPAALAVWPAARRTWTVDPSRISIFLDRLEGPHCHVTGLLGLFKGNHSQNDGRKIQVSELFQFAQFFWGWRLLREFTNWALVQSTFL